jgi:hypothetical protein
MPGSVIDIANISLGKIGVPKITSLVEGTPSANQVSLVWGYTRDEILAEHDWSFAVSRVALAMKAEEPAGRYAYAYALPVNFINVCQPAEDDPPVSIGGIEIDYAIEVMPDGTKCLLSDYSSVYGDVMLKYIMCQDNVSVYPPLFIQCLSYRLAAELAIILTESPKKYDAMMSLYDMWLKKAKASDRKIGNVKDELGNNDWLYAGR